MFSSSPRLIAAYHVFRRLQRQGIRLLLLITCFSIQLLFLPCSIVKELTDFPSAAGLNSGLKPSSSDEAFSQNSIHAHVFFGGDGGNRTHDILLAKQTLSHLSYRPIIRAPEQIPMLCVSYFIIAGVPGEFKGKIPLSYCAGAIRWLPAHRWQNQWAERPHCGGSWGDVRRTGILPPLSRRTGSDSCPVH